MGPDLNLSKTEMDALVPKRIGQAALVLGIMMVLVFGHTMLCGDASVLSKIKLDIYSCSLTRNEFSFGQLRQGNFALWCPAGFCGFPNFGGFQSWLVYPLALPYLFMSAVTAINWCFILHTFLGGMFMYLWLGRQSLHRNACLAGALMFAFCAPLYLRLYAGHPTVHATIIWIPLLFLAIDGLIAAPSLGWLLLGTTAVSMQLLAGFPQVVFYTAIAAGFYTLAKLPWAPKIRKSISLLALMNVFALGLTCVQWTAAAAMAEECVRKGGLSYPFASTFSLPPENWLTLIRPGLFGNMEVFPYWGRCYLWEMCLYFGIVGLFFSVIGLWHPQRRRIQTIAVIAAIMGMFALGSHSPHFRFFYDYVPGFNMFRGNSKFIILVVIFLIFLSAHGIDMLFCKDVQKQLTRRVFIGAVATCVALVVPMVFAASCQHQTFWDLMSIPLNSLETMFDQRGFIGSEMVLKAARFMAGELQLALCVLVGLTVLLGLLWWRPQWRNSLYLAVVGLLALELLQFAWSEHVSFSPNLVRRPNLEQYLKTNLGDSRIFCPNDYSNIAQAMPGVSELWGYGSDSVIRRYAEFMAFTQGDNPDQVTGYQVFKALHPRYDLLRCKYVLFPQPDGTQKIVEIPGALPKVLLITDWRVVEKRDEVFTAITRPEFNPRQSVLLERQPAGWPAATAATGASAPEEAGRVGILRESTDWQEVEVTLAKPAILLQTDLYTPNWHVYALPGSAQTAYELIPANYILRAVPLQAGTHRLRIEYRPMKFVVGKWVSLMSLALFIPLLVVWGFRIRQHCKSRTLPASVIP